MTDMVQRHCTRSWGKRPPVLLLGIAAVLLVIFSFAGAAGRPPAIPSGAFLDLLETANASVVWFASQTQTIVVVFGAIISFKPMLLVFGGLFVAGAARAMDAAVRIAQPAAAIKESIT